MLERFDDLVRRLVLKHRGSLVKQIGDEFMIVFGEPADAARFAVALDEAAGREENFPALRMALNHGPVVFRLGDYVGNTVNVASRIASMGTSGEVLMTEPVARAAEKVGIAVNPVGVRVARGVSEPLTLSRITRRREIIRRDPVCGMAVGERATARLVHDGSELAFCSTECLRRFLEEPERYPVAHRATGSRG